jgi:hypothetical protein
LFHIRNRATLLFEARDSPASLLEGTARLELADLSIEWDRQLVAQRQEAQWFLGESGP